MPIEAREVRAFEGPNLYYPQPAVRLTVWADRDISRQISDTLKTWAQAIGLVIGYLRQQTQPAADGVVITTTWTTPLPTVGAKVAQQVVADLQAAERHDEEYSHDDALFEVIGERKRQEPSMLLLQVYAEAHAHDLPVTRRPDGHLMIGSGARGWSFDPAMLSLGLSVDAPWDSIGTIPVIAVTGPDAVGVTQVVAALLQQAGQRVGRAARDGITIAGAQVSDQAGDTFGGARRVLTDEHVDVAVIEVGVQDVLQRGLGFDQCRVGVVTGIDEHAGSSSRAELVDAHGIVVLTTEEHGATVFNADVPEVQSLRAWAPGAVVLYSEHAPQNVDIEAVNLVYSDQTTVHIMWEGQHTTLALAHPSAFQPAQILPAVAAVRALGIDIATLPQFMAK